MKISGGKSLQRKTCRRFITLLFLLFFLGYICRVSACDDTIILLLTAQNPSSEFSKCIRVFSSDLTSLGLALKAKEISRLDGLLEKVMASWITFSTKFALNPPPEAKNDYKWLEKVQETTSTIGLIRKATIAGELQEAHNEVLNLSGKLGTFFEAVGISDVKRIFLQISEHFVLLETARISDNIPSMMNPIASLSMLLDSLADQTPPQGLQSLESTRTDLEAFKLHLSETARTTPETEKLLLTTQNQFNELRSFILMAEWFPGLVENSDQ